jgi:hypothetical protein
MQALYAEGHQAGLAGYGWLKAPAGIEVGKN